MRDHFLCRAKKLASSSVMGIFIFVSASTQAMPIETSNVKFNTKNANQQFDQINLKLSTENLNRADLDNAVNILSKLDEQAVFCVNEAQNKLDALTMLETQDGNVTNLANQGVDSIFLNKQKKQLASEQAECHLFSIRAKEAIFAYKKTSAQFVKQEAFTKDAPLWESIAQLIKHPENVNFDSFDQKSLSLTLPANWIMISWIGFSLIMAIIFLLKLQNNRFARHFLRADLLRVSTVLLLSTCLCSSGFFIYEFIQFTPKAQVLTSMTLPTLLCCYILALTFILFIFKIKPIRNYYLAYSLDSNFFKNLSVSIVSIGAVGLIGAMPSSPINNSNEMWQLCLSAYLLLTLCAALYFVHYFCCEHRHYPFIKNYQRTLKAISMLWAVSCFIIDIQGYHRLAMHIVFSSLTALGIASITIFLTLKIHKTYLLIHKKPALHAWIMRYIGYKQNQPFTEILILKSIAQILVIAFGVYLIGHSLDFATFYIESMYLQILYGFHIASIVIYPINIISGTATFCLLFLMFRALSTIIVRHHQFKQEKETQVALASILTYIGFTLALLAGLIIAGFNFTGLAIVAGALSVGIGLGLQSIVNNFVSGLILLIEKPIQPGDRINVDGVEGFVNKIRVRSTHIVTPNQEDIIIPNSDLITRRVTNYMFSDTNCRISCEVGVIYGSDTRLVREILLNIAAKHEDVVNTSFSKPFVLLRSFGATNLVFQLWCLIKDVNRKIIVQSDINFAIEEQFRLHNIYMVLPQNDARNIVPKPIVQHTEESTK